MKLIIAWNAVKQNGFQTKAQMRFLLYLMQQYPSKYSWVKDVLRDHGVPSDEGPLHTYWSGPYNVSPETPSYVYHGKGKKKRKATLIDRLRVFGGKLDSHPELLDELDDTITMLEHETPQAVANQFWSLWKNDMRTASNPEDLAMWMDRFYQFAEMRNLSPQDVVEAQRYLGDKLLGRTVQ